jgi:two-component system, NarL family, invasion response regulator UvrY
MAVKVLIADDHTVVREGVKKIISQSADLQVVAEAGNADELFESIRHREVDVLVLDMSMPGKDGIDVLRRLRNENPELPVLILSVHPEEEFALRVLKAGASGYLTKDSPPEQLLLAIKRVAAGRKFVSSAVAEKLTLSLERDYPRKLHEKLSDREYQVLRLLGTGKTVSEIAAGMALSVKTVSTYRVRILEKMQLQNNAELMRYAHEHGLVDS